MTRDELKDIIKESLRESMIVNEAGLDSYPEKVIKSINKNLNDLHKAVPNKKFLIYMHKNQKKILNRSGIKIPVRFINYNLNAMNSIRIQSFDYERMKQFKNEDEFIKALYPTLFDKDIKLEDKIKATVKSKTNITVDQSQIKKMYSFTSSDYNNYLQVIDREAKMLVNSLESVSKISSSVSEGTLYEADIDVTGDQNRNNTNNRENIQGNGKKSGNLTKTLRIYTSITSKILSTKMKLLHEMYNYYIQVLSSI